MDLLWKAIADQVCYGWDKKRTLRHLGLICLQVWMLQGAEIPPLELRSLMLFSEP